MSQFVPGRDLEPELRGYYDQVLQVNDAVEELVSGLTSDQLQWKPEPHSWSIAQCLDHLVACGQAEMPSVRRAIVEAREGSSASYGSFVYGLLGWIVVRAMAPNGRLKFKAPRAYRPAGNKAPPHVIREFFLVQQEWLDCICKANGLDLVRTTVPVLHYRNIRLSLRQDLKLFVVHEQRHIVQAQRIRDALKA